MLEAYALRPGFSSRFDAGFHVIDVVIKSFYSLDLTSHDVATWPENGTF